MTANPVTVQVTRTRSVHASTTTETRKQIVEELKGCPELFFDMRQAKQSPNSPDFKHKFRYQALWLNGASQDLLQLVRQWDANQSSDLRKVSSCTSQQPSDRMQALSQAAGYGQFCASLPALDCLWMRINMH